MELIDTEIPEVKIIQPRVFRDDRGYFMETWNYRTLYEAGLDVRFVQDNESYSTKGTLRGIHYQLKNPQGKLVRAIVGSVYDIAVDLRRDSPTFGKSVGTILSEDNKRQLWVPEGFGHAYYTISQSAIFAYKCTDYYHANDSYELRWDDPELGITWPIEEGQEVILSAKDREAPTLKALMEAGKLY